MMAPQSDNEPLDVYESGTLDLDKLAVEMADRISARRATSNSFFLTVQTTFVAVVAFAAPALKDRPWWSTAVIAAAGFAISFCWWLLLRSYRDLNKAKFEVVLEIEEAARKDIHGRVGIA